MGGGQCLSCTCSSRPEGRGTGNGWAATRAMPFLYKTQAGEQAELAALGTDGFAPHAPLEAALANAGVRGVGRTQLLDREAGRGFSCLQRLVQANLKCFPPSCLMKCANPLLVLHRAQASRYERRWKKTNRPWTPASGSPLPPGGAFMHPHTARGPGSQARTASHQESVTIVCPGFSLSVMAAISAM